MGTYGNLERNSLHGPSFRQVDFVASKHWPFSPERNIEFRIEVFNLFNVANFTNPVGTLPLALTRGAGAGAQNAIGTAVTGGLLSATFIDLLFIPFFFVLVSRLFARKRVEHPGGEPSAIVNTQEVN